jgi:hypothetical protein
MDRRAVPNYQQLAGDSTQKVLEETHHVLPLQSLLLLDHVKLAIEGDGAHRREMISAMSRSQRMGVFLHWGVRSTNDHGEHMGSK